jgi:hypothetical protein
MFRGVGVRQSLVSQRPPGFRFRLAFLTRLFVRQTQHEDVDGIRGNRRRAG